MYTFKFYTPEGTEIDKTKFIKMYGDSYYLDKKSYAKSATKRGILQSSRFIEDSIDRLLKNGIKTETDIIHILAWKIGKIKHKQSESEKKFIYAKDWINAEKFDIMRYGESFVLETFINYIVDNIEKLEKQAETDPQELLSALAKEAPKGIGTVYLITLLYFISKGKYPIYDRFAQMSLYAILNDKKPFETVNYKELPEKNSRAFSNIISKDIKEYMSEIEQVFGSEYQYSRDIDRALWVYGHQFYR